MATASPLQEHITCDICMETYTDPKILKCLHTFCLECINKIKRNTDVECPSCRKVTKVDEIQQDFKTQSLIDLNIEKWGHKDSPSPSTDGSKHCDMCQVWEKLSQSQCVDCNQFMCADCEKAHRGSVVSKSHNIVTHVDRLKSLQGFLIQSRNDLEEDTQHIQDRSDDIVKCIHNLMQSEEEQLAFVKKCKEQRYKEIEDHHEKLEGTIKDANAKIIDVLTANKYTCDQLKESIQSKIEFLTEKIKIEDIFTLTEIVSSLEGTLNREKIDALKRDLDNTKTNVQSPVTVEMGEKLDLDNCTKVKIVDQALTDKVNCDDLMLIDFGAILETPYSELINRDFVQQKSLNLDGSAISLARVEGELWIADYEHGIYIYNKDLELTKQIINEKIKYCCGLACVRKEDIIVACSGGNGLIQINSDGNIQTKLACGSFADVHFYKNKLYALEHKGCAIHVLEEKENTWSDVHTFKIKDTTGSRWDKLHVCSFGIYTSIYNSNLVLHHNLSGEIQNDIKTTDSNVDECLQGPNVCDVDNEGNVMVADCENNRVQVYTMQGQWKTLPLKDNIERPLYVNIDQQGRQLYLITDVPKKLCKYSWN